MRQAATYLLALALASSVCRAQTDEQERVEDVGTVYPVVPVETVLPKPATITETVWTLKPFVVQLIQVLVSKAPDPEEIRVLVDRLKPGEFAPVVVALAENPKALAVFVASMTPQQIERVTLDLFKTPETFRVFVTRLSVDQLSIVIVGLAQNPRAISVILSTITPEQFRAVFVDLAKDPLALRIALKGVTPEEAARVCLSLAGSPDAFEVAVRCIDLAKLKKTEISLFLFDVEAWQRFAAILSEPDAAPNPARKFDNTWQDAARAKLRKKIEAEGWTPEVIAAAEAMMKRAAAPLPTPSKWKN